MFRSTIKRSFIITLALLQVVLFPRIGLAVSGSPATTDTKPVTSSKEKDSSSQNTKAEATGPTAPTGADGGTYTYNEKTKLWENDYYTWDPATKQTSPKGTQTYSYNPDTKHWDTTQYRYDAAADKYVPNTVEVTAPPANATIADPDPSAHTTQRNAVAAKNLPASETTDKNNAVDGSSYNKTANNNGAYDLFYDASISNTINGNARTGDASVLNNTSGGSALTGNALSQATVLNMLQSVWDPSRGDIATFTADIDGDVTGDLTIDPGQIPQNLSVDGKTNNNLTINASENTAINNKINLAADSGNATVDHNSSAGDATTGTAAAVANVVNLINSVIGSGQSFVGTININGNLNGDILLPPDMLNQLLASNVPRATISTSDISNGNLLANFNNNQTIKNTINTDAASGNANVGNNSSAGNATTGSATNNITVLNLTGRDIIGSNAMLVFVNVLGNWVGMIMDAPGATSAALGGGITSDTANNTNVNINEDSNQTINNDITLAAHSGNANVTDNTKAGNATSGDVKTAANLANVTNSKMSLSNWFGVLFINVFGSWLGSFGVNTAAGNIPAAPSNTTTTAPDVKVFQFIPAASGGTTSLAPVPTTGNLGTGTTGSSDNNNTTAVSGAVLGDSTVKPVYGGVSVDAPNNIVRMYLVLAFLSLIIMSGGKLFAYFKARKVANL